MDSISSFALRVSVALIFSCFIFPFVASQADLSPLWDDNFSQTFNNVETNPDFYSLDAETNPDFSSLDAETNPGFYSLDAETSPDYYTLDAENNPDFYTSDVEPIWSSPDQVSQGTFGLFSDPDTDLLAGVGEGCPPNGQPINKSRKRNDACPAPGSSDDSQLRIPNPLDAKKKGELAPTSDDSDICRVFEALQARFFAVCDSGRPNDRILNRATGEYSLIDCERVTLFNVMFCVQPRQVYCCSSYKPGQVAGGDFASGCHQLST